MNNEGVRHKPLGCKFCPQSFVGVGFCPDSAPANPKFMLLLETPTADDVVNQSPLSGSMGHFLEWKVLKAIGIRREEILISNVLRCKLPKIKAEDKKEKYPVGKYKNVAEKHCRQYDTAIKKFDPNLFVMTYSFMDTFGDGAYFSLLINDLKRAVKLSENPENRVCVLCGSKAVELINNVPFKDGKGGLKQFRGHYFPGKWNY